MSQSRTLPIFEFPEWLGAITVRELRAGLMGRDLVFLLIATQVVLAFAGMYAVEWSATTPRQAADMLRGVTYAAAAIGLLAHAPMRALRGLHGDRDSGLLALLQITPQTSGRIVLGKWLSGAIQTALFLVTLLPYFVLRYFVGGADILAESQILLGAFAFSLVLQATGLLLSTLPRLLRILALLGIFVCAIAVTGNVLARAFTPYGAIRQPVPQLLFTLVATLMLVPLLLSAAAQAIAAPAENYVARYRLFLVCGVLALFGYSLLASNLSSGWGAAALLMTLGLVAVSSFFEFAAPGEFLPAHVPRVLKRVPLAESWVKFLVPGWRSAAYFYPALLALILGFALMLQLTAPLLHFAAQLGASLLMPRVLLELFGLRSRRSGIAMFILLHGSIAFVGAVVVAAYSLSLTVPAWPQFIPGLGLWTGLSWAESGWGIISPLAWLAVFTVFLAVRGRDEMRRASAVARSLRSSK